ncbi:MAG: hypothetical protein ACTTJX_04525 [Fusobacterium sp.]|uniref:hypothetical protein n=1 Tax=Fusobacterium sp. TaxID=68766 RepID=UPI003FA069F1
MKIGMKKTMKKKVLKIMELGLEVNRRIKKSFFMNYFGHTNSINIEIYSTGWSENKKADYNKIIFLDLENANKKIIETIKVLEELKGE